MIKYTLDLLNSIKERDKCIILTQHTSFTSESIIEFTCKCGMKHEKTFSSLYKSTGAFCKKCTSEISREKYKKTNIIKYGVENPMQNTEIKEKFNKSMIKIYGVKSPMQNFEIKQKTKQTNLRKYGVENPMQNDDIKKKLKLVILTKYKVEYPMQSEIIKEKLKQTNLRKYGVENPMQNDNIKKKLKLVILRKYKVEYPMQSKIIKEKLKQNNIKKYGVEHIMHVPKFAEKQLINSFKLKKFIFPNGSIRKVQGYEPIALQKLINDGYNEEDITTSRKDVPCIWYEYNNKKHRYYCDIYIQSENKIIEVKSKYTYMCDKKINDFKSTTCKELKFDFEFWIIDKDIITIVKC